MYWETDMGQIGAIIFGAFFIACLAAAVVLLYGDKPMSVSPCRTCTADCPSKGKEIKPEEAAVTCASTKAKDDINDKIRKLKQQDTGKGEQDV